LYFFKQRYLKNTLLKKEKMVSYPKLFNQVVDEFFNELMELYPKNNNVKVKYNLFLTISAVNIKKPAIDFMNQVVPYLEQIAMRDEEFFLGENSPDIIKANIKSIWTPDISETTKNAIWKYIKSFITIGNFIVEMPHETQNVINYIIHN
jgi:hypothetical protein